MFGRRRRFDPKLALASGLIAGSLVLIGWGVMGSVTGDGAVDLPDAIESISPRPDAVQVPSQTSVVVDLGPGFEGTIEIDGVAYEPVDRSALRPEQPEPGQQVAVPAGAVFDPGNNTITFTAGDEVGFDEFAEGSHRVRVIYWLIEDEGANARSYIWTFNVV